MESKNEDRIQNDIKRGSDEHRSHCRLRLPLCCNKRIQSEYDLYKKCADQVNPQICTCVRVSRIACSYQIQKWFFCRIKYSHDTNRKNAQHCKNIAKDPLCLSFIALSKCDRRKRCTACSRKGTECGNNRDHRKCQSKSGQRLPSDALPDVNAIHNVIQKIDQLGHQRRNSHGKHQTAKRPCSEFFF